MGRIKLKFKTFESTSCTYGKLNVTVRVPTENRWCPPGVTEESFKRELYLMEVWTRLKHIKERMLEPPGTGNKRDNS